MPKVTNVSTDTSTDCEAGTSLQEVSEKGNLGIPFGCSTGICSTCLIKIKSGGENLSERTEQEDFTLEARGAGDNERLACQCKINGDVEFEQ